MKKLLLLGLIIFAFGEINAQGKYGEDSVTCVQNISLYRDYYKQKMYDDAYGYWKVAFKICPAASERMYVDGVNLVNRKIRGTKDAAIKAAYIDTLMQVYDQRIANFGKECFVLGRKGTDMLRYKGEDPEPVFTVLEKSVNGCGPKTEAGAAVSYMNATVLMEKAGKKSKEDVVAVYGLLSGIVSQNIQKYQGKKTAEYYVKAEESIGNVASPYLSCEVLIEMANNNFERNKENQDWMERTADLLDKKGCTDDPIFFKLAQTLHATSPSAISAEKMGIMSLKTKKYQEAVDYFQQALSLSQDETKHSDYYIELAQAYSSMGSYSSARTNALKAAKLKPGFGLPYIMIGDMIAASTSCGGDDACAQKAIYWLAVDYYTKAKSIDPSVAATANGKIASYKKYFPSQQDCFFGGTKEGDSVQIGCWIGESTKARF